MIFTNITATNASAAPTHALICQLGQLLRNVCGVMSYSVTPSNAITPGSAVESAKLAVCAGRLAVGLEPSMPSLLLPASCGQPGVARPQQPLQHHDASFMDTELARELQTQRTACRKVPDIRPALAWGFGFRRFFGLFAQSLCSTLTL